MQSAELSQVDAVVLAGAINRIPLFPGNKPGRKALVELHGRPMIATVLDALRECPQVARILVVGAPEVLEYASQWPGVVGVPERESLLANAEAGLENARTDWVFFCNPDQPLLRAPMIQHFLEAAQLRTGDSDLVTSWVRKESLGRYTEGEHKFACFKDGVYAHGNLFLVRRDFPELEEVRARFNRLYNARKSNLKFAWELGPKLFMLFVKTKVTGCMPSLTETLDIAGNHFGLRISAVVGWEPEIALDIDEPEDYAAAERHLQEDEECGRVKYSVS